MSSPHIPLFEVDLTFLAQDVDRLARRYGLSSSDVLNALDRIMRDSERYNRAQARLADFFPQASYSAGSGYVGRH